MTRGLPKRRKIPGVSKIVAVSSAKGGVGKSTVAANLAIGFAQLGLRSGILDTDLFGPSVPTLFDLEGETAGLDENNRMVPLTNYGVGTMSMGYLVAPEKAVVWRGLMVMKALEQLFWQTEWGKPGLDVLVVDLPPGTGDTQLTVVQEVVVDRE